MWSECTRGMPCPICGGTNWCSVADSGEVCKCMRIEDGAFKTSNDGSGQASFHRLTGEIAKRVRTVVKPNKPLRAPRSLVELETILSASWVDSYRLCTLAEELGVPLHTLGRLQVGWLSAERLAGFDTKCSAEGAYTFPMVDREGDLCGFRLRCNGFKYSLHGGHNGFFVPSGLIPGTGLTIVEGPSDTAAALAYLRNVIGRPNNNALPLALAALIGDLQPTFVHIIIDNDPSDNIYAVRNTLEGARHLKRVAGIYVPQAQIEILRPKSCKDVRDVWKQGASLEEELEIVL